MACHTQVVRVLICPDKFAGTLSAPEVAAAVASGWKPDDLLVQRPLSDGGPGFVEVLEGLTPGTSYVTANSYLIKADIEKAGASHDH